MTTALLIANPAASQFTGGLHRTAMQTLGRHYDVRAIWPQSAEHSRIAARDAARSGVALVIAMGGDGIVHHVAQGLIGTDGVLGIIPSGTTNVVARLFGLPKSPKEAARLLSDSFSVLAAPTVEVHGEALEHAWSAHAVFSLGVGPDAMIVAEAETEPYRKYRFGSFHYARTALGVMWGELRSREPDLTISTPTARRGIGAMVQIHHSYTYFGRIPLRVDTELPDPMSVLTIERLPMRRAGSVVRRAATGTLERVAGMAVDRRVAELTIEADDTTQLQLDGEHYGTVRRLTARGRPNSLLIAVSPSKDD